MRTDYLQWRRRCIGDQGRFLDTWTLLSVIAARTSRLRVFPDVASLPLRPPAVLAKSAATLDLLAGGRVGLGAGAFWDAIAAMGGPRRSLAEAIDALREAIDVIRLMWSGQRSARSAGATYSLGGLHPGPRPAHDIGIWLGVYKPKGLALVGSKRRRLAAHDALPRPRPGNNRGAGPHRRGRRHCRT